MLVELLKKLNLTNGTKTNLSPQQWLKKPKKMKLVTLKQAEKVHGLYEYVLSGKKVLFKLLAKKSDPLSMAREMAKAVEEKRKVMLVIE